MVERAHSDWTASYSAAPLMPTTLLRRIAELGRVHFYTSTGDVVWATQNLLGVSVHHAGPRQIALPFPATVTDLYTGASLGEKVRSFGTDFGEYATKVFNLK